MRFTEFQGIPNNAAPHVGPLTIDDTARPLTSLITLDPATQWVNIKVETAALRLTVNGTPPTGTLGKNYVADTEFMLSRQEADNCQLVRSTGASSAIQVAQYKA